MSLQGRVAVVSGAGAGIGAATARLLAGAGAIVHSIDIDQDGLKAQAELIAAAGGTSTWSVVDVADEEAVAATLHDVGEVDIVVASHGVNSIDDDDIGALESDLFRRIIAVNLGGTTWLARHSTAALRRSPHGVFIAMASVAAFTPPSGPAYAASKGGILALVRTMAHQLAADGVRCLTVTPGPIETQMMTRALAKRGQSSMTMPPGTIQRVGQPEDVARLVRFLVSDDASYITQTNVTIDGGYTPF
jgi:NAD(P)-dependent dehydrogenase (short-subunit alcohol dehydrogenase family)